MQNIYLKQSLNYLLTKVKKKTVIKYFKDSRIFHWYKFVFPNIVYYNQNEKREILLLFYDMVTDMLIDRKLEPIVTESTVRARKLNTYLVFITQLSFFLANNITLTFTLYFLMKIQNKRELNQIGFSHLSYIVFDNFTKIVMKCTNKLYSFSVNDITFY